MTTLKPITLDRKPAMAPEIMALHLRIDALARLVDAESGISQSRRILMRDELGRMREILERRFGPQAPDEPLSVQPIPRAAG